MVKKIENYKKPQLPNKREFLNSKNIVTIISAGLLTITLGCSGNTKLVDSAKTSKNIETTTKALNDSTKTTYPNPFMPTSSISFNVKESTMPHNVILKIYNGKGNIVRNLINSTFDSGEHKISWDGKDDEGNSVASGIYFYQLDIDGEINTKKMVLMK